MRSSTSGPIGAFLMIGPLLAIPVFAVVGIPQFAPVVASSVTEEELPPEAVPSRSVALPVKVGTASHGAADLYAPYPDDAITGRIRPVVADQSSDENSAPLWNEPAGASPVRPEPASRSIEFAAADTQQPDLSPGARQPPPEALDGWEVADDLMPEPPPARQPAPAPRELTPSAAAPVVEVAEPLTWKRAAQRLQELGIHKYRLERIPQKQRFVFTCAVTAPGDGRVSRRFEAEADEPLLAVQSVLDQIDEWQAAR